MFSTLRQTSGDGDRLLSVEIAPPFDKDRMSMRTACERCRVQKSKCVSGENGCMLCVAKNQKCEYLVVSRPRRRKSNIAGGGPKSRDDNDDEDGDNTVVNQQKQSNQARMQKRWSRMQTIRQSSPLSGPSSPPTDQVRVSAKPSIQDDNSNIIGPDLGLEDAHQIIFNGGLFPDSLGQIPALFPHLEPAAIKDFFSNMPIATENTHAGRGVTAEALTARGDSGGLNSHTSVYSTSSADSLFDFGVDQMDFLMDESRITAIAPRSTSSSNKVARDIRAPATHSSTPSESNSTSISTSSSCSCMMTAVGIYEALQVELNWGDPIAGPSATSSPKSSSAGSSYSSGPPSWSDSGSITNHSTTLMTQQTILKRQKTVLLRCDSLTRCSTCWSRPDFVMLIITICDRILTSLEAVERFVCNKKDDDIDRISSNGSTTAVDIQAARTELDSSLSTTSQGLQSGVGAWQIDDEDEQEMVISLIKSRVTRLGNLINIAEGTISANGWPWHERLAQALRRRSNKLAISLSFRGFP
ncbi:hypothetical protein FGSG_08182 [Fusarium graminearum PH-1]|uniref:Chromosome 2, complete genome n=1 Tax=Gibberella zeae (strain ATCC MYA-4620 / CBS 123657 / FGSC 9075 / NRRL 31084 / PH-1) TaxID=229533 RepID=I1RVB5_GIBZE|nr:hypothetical protein FGSG_08182 [Fusarium graminearum PH-1]ESU15205.1 hypothetical protein FGSG_08182 [Fusarium graminearum PH-1]CEF76453.1 unnamed protein product [Fusarium graminearum]|eukprot:XP_011320630.1 hypothetical protein FGSG_08182 [Fusarium graminearum PH-1]